MQMLLRNHDWVFRLLLSTFSCLFPAVQVISVFLLTNALSRGKTASMVVPRISDFLDKVLDCISTFIEGVDVFFFFRLFILT